jgi:hypothetical protein
VLVEVVAFQRRVGCAKGDGLGDDLLDAAAGPDGLVAPEMSAAWAGAVTAARPKARANPSCFV